MLNTTAPTSAKFYLFLNEDWKEITEATECQQKLEKARAVCKYQQNYRPVKIQEDHIELLPRWIFLCIVRDFPSPDLGPNIAPSQLENKQKLPKMVYIIPNFLVLHFGEDFMKIGTKNTKVKN